MALTDDLKKGSSSSGHTGAGEATTAATGFLASRGEGNLLIDPRPWGEGLACEDPRQLGEGSLLDRSSSFFGRGPDPRLCLDEGSILVFSDEGLSLVFSDEGLILVFSGEGLVLVI